MSIMQIGELMVAVEAAFALTAAGSERWDDPHPPPDRIVAEEEYSRVTNPAKWRIIGARADAWIVAMVEAGVATVERDASPEWVEPPSTDVTRTDLVTPTSRGAIPLVVCRGRIDDVADAGVTLGAGDPAVQFAFIPDCGCDACDNGSQDVLDELDSCIRPVVTGEFRSLRRGRKSITVLGDDRRQGSNIGLGDGDDGIPGGWFRYLPTSRPSNLGPGDPQERSTEVPARRGRTRDRMSEILANPVGWEEVSGPSWLTERQRDMRH